MEKKLRYAMTVAAILPLLGLLSCTCDTTTGQRETSPSGKYAALVEGMGCGTLRSYESHVMIERYYRLFGHLVWTSQKGVFRATVNVHQLAIHWSGDRNLMVHCYCKPESVIFNDPRWGGVGIEYEFAP